MDNGDGKLLRLKQRLKVKPLAIPTLLLLLPPGSYLFYVTAAL
jgi:hypothetical protein